MEPPRSCRHFRTVTWAADGHANPLEIRECVVWKLSYPKLGEEKVRINRVLREGTWFRTAIMWVTDSTELISKTPSPSWIGPGAPDLDSSHEQDKRPCTSQGYLGS